MNISTTFEINNVKMTILPLGLWPRLFITTFSSGNVNTPSSSLSKSIKTSLKSETCSSVNCHSVWKIRFYCWNCIERKRERCLYVNICFDRKWQSLFSVACSQIRYLCEKKKCGKSFHHKFSQILCVNVTYNVINQHVASW